MKRIVIALILLINFAGASAQTKKPAAKPAAKPSGTHSLKPQQGKPSAKHSVVKKPAGKPEQKVAILTEYGTIVVKLYNETPLHRDNFIKLVKQGFYDSLLFHRVISQFMIQGGDPGSKYADSNAMLGGGDVGYKIPAEINSNLYHKRGALAAARDNNPEKMSSGCQFYIVQGRKFTTQELEQIINSRNMNRKQEILYRIYGSDSVQQIAVPLQQSGDKEKLRVFLEQIQKQADNEYRKTYPDAEKVNLDQMEEYVFEGGAPHLDGAYTVFGEVVSGMEVVDKIAALPKNGERPVTDVRMKMILIP